MSSSRYSVLMVGLLADLRRAGCLDEDTLKAYVGIHTNPARRTIPGLVYGLGSAGFAESVFLSERASKRACARLAAAGKVVLDWDARAIYAAGAVLLDPFVNPPSVKAGARNWFELEPSPVKASVRADIEAALLRQKRDPKKESQKLLIEVWRDELADLDGRSHTAPEGLSDTGLDSSLEGLSSDPSLRSRSTDPAAAAASVTRPPDPKTAARYQDAWDHRLPCPPFAAAAAEDFLDVSARWTEQAYGMLLVQLACSKWVTGQLQVPPTLRRLLDDQAYVGRIIRGEFAAIRPTEWKCIACACNHPPLESCPEKRPCGRRHPDREWCATCRRLEADLEPPAPMPADLREKLTAAVGRRSM